MRTPPLNSSARGAAQARAQLVHKGATLALAYLQPLHELGKGRVAGVSDLLEQQNVVALQGVHLFGEEVSIDGHMKMMERPCR